MGLPETVDSARNFAVMVRVQGPDPKGLKMRRHAFHHYNSGKTTLSASGMLLPSSFVNDVVVKQFVGESGDTLMPGHLVITVASVIEPFLAVRHRENIAKAKHELVTGSQIDVLVEGKKRNEHGIHFSDKEAATWLSGRLLTLVEIPVASVAVQSLIEASTGASDHGWDVGWSLASFSNGPQPFVNTLQQQVHQSSMRNNGQVIGEESNSPTLMGKSATRVAVLKVSSIQMDLPNLSISTPNNNGDLLLAIGSPFGVLSPVHFFNSISVGSIANCYPAASCNKSLLMADIRCLPGMEGSPVFSEHAQLIGILTRPLRQRASGAEIQLVIPWEAIATSCNNLLHKEPVNAWEWVQANKENSTALGKISETNYLDLDRSFNHVHEKHSPPSHVENAMASICLITVDDGAWASGVVMNKQGLILTNAHLLEPWRFRKAAAGEKTGEKSDVIFTPSFTASPESQKFGGQAKSLGFLSTRLRPADLPTSDERKEYNYNMVNKINKRIRVRLDSTDPWVWIDAKIVFVSQGPLDVALLQLDFVPEQLHPIGMDFTCPFPGSAAYVIGHGLFGPRRDFFPSACLGVVAKVVKARRSLAQKSGEQEIEAGQIPAMIETTAAVHPGGSGGAVVNSDGHMIGLVTSNARHGGGMIIPHLNFSIPSAALEPIFKFSKDMTNLSLLEVLDKPDEHISSVWALVPPLSPKPGPSLPDLSKFLPEDNIKDTKGSRFAKFIAERHELLKDKTQAGKEKVFTNSMPSKL